MRKLFKISILIFMSFFYINQLSAKEIKMINNKQEIIILAGGCFWGIEAVFEHTKGVINSVSGYAGGLSETAKYDMIVTGTTGHAEAVEVTYNPDIISLSQLLDIYFNVAHNPTQLNYQGPDHGTQYRSAIFYATAQQKIASQEKIDAYDKKKVFSNKIVTALEPLVKFYPAETYHQDYAARNPNNPYIIVHDAPKVKKLKQTYPELYKE